MPWKGSVMYTNACQLCMPSRTATPQAAALLTISAVNGLCSATEVCDRWQRCQRTGSTPKAEQNNFLDVANWDNRPAEKACLPGGRVQICLWTSIDFTMEWDKRCYKNLPKTERLPCKSFWTGQWEVQPTLVTQVWLFKVKQCWGLLFPFYLGMYKILITWKGSWAW